MDFIKFSIEKPVSIIVGIILVVMFGILALFQLPYQLTPNVTEPEITVTTTWRGATPYEMEREVVEEQEKVLKGIPNLIEMESECFNSESRITLKFKIGTNTNDALLRVSNKLNEVPEYPDNADRPIISATGSATSPVIWMILRSAEGNNKGPGKYLTYFENEVKQYLERVHGVADLFMGGGVEEEMHIIVEPEALAAYNLTVPDLIRTLQAENINVSAGNLGVGRRDYRIRTTAEFKTPEEIEDTVILSSGQERIRIKDIGHVTPGYEKSQVAMLHNGHPGVAIGIKPEPGTNVLTLTAAVKMVVNELNAGKLKDQGIYLDWVYDEVPYITGAIDLVKQNIIIGGLLAIVVLLIFLRSIRSTIIVALSIPISIIGSFIIFNAAGRTLNVVSMAGISFAVGMLVDNAIVVLENIDRHRQMGKPAYQAAYEGTKEVWGAVFASTLTTVAVFLPVVFIQEEAGQLFKDISIAVTCAIILSLFVSISVIPMLANQLFKHSKGKKKGGFGFVDKIGSMVAGTVMGLVSMAIKNWFTRIATVLILTGASLAMAYFMMPEMEYLPQGNRNFVMSILIPPPGMSYEEKLSVGEYVANQTDPYFDKDVGDMPGIKQLFYVGAPTISIFGASSIHEDQAAKMIPMFNKIMFSIPGMIGVSIQSSIFESGLGEGRMVAVDVSGPDLKSIIAAAGTMYGMISKEIPNSQIRPLPSLELLYPEVKINPSRDHVKAAGMTSNDLGVTLDVLMDGRKIGDYKAEGKKKIDLVLKSSDEEMKTPEDLYNALVSTHNGRAIPVANLATLDRTYGMTEIRHLERQRTVTLQVTPPVGVPLEHAMNVIHDKVIPAVKSMGLMKDITVRMSGAADKLTVTRDALSGNFVLAIAITYLLMASLFSNFIYPFIILFTVPLAGAGGFLGLWLENVFIAPQSMDVLTMLGFVILIGIVVNNAILIVHQALNNVREGGMDYKEAVLESTRTRLRPIYMSATTSIFGMLPLAVAPGPGSELYRGLGAVVLGGLALSTFFTVFVIPSLLMFFIGMEKTNASALDRNNEGAEHSQSGTKDQGGSSD